MTESKSINAWDIGKVLGVAAVSLGINYLIQTKLLEKPKTKKQKRQMDAQ